MAIQYMYMNFASGLSGYFIDHHSDLHENVLPHDING